MNVTVDLLVLPDDTLLAKSPAFPAWKFASDDPADFADRAEKSLRRHIGKVLAFSWHGWNGQT